MVREPIAYEYTSYGKFVTPVLGDKEGYSTKKVTAMINELVETDKVLGTFRHTPREQYRMFVEGKISHAVQKKLMKRREDINSECGTTMAALNSFTGRFSVASAASP